MVATDATDALTGSATAEVRIEFNNISDDGNGGTTTVADVIGRAISAPLGAADLTTTYQPITISYTLTQADLDAALAIGQAMDPPIATPINSVVGVMGTNEHGDGATDGMIYFDDFVFEVSDGSVVVVGDGHDTAVLKGDVDLDGTVNFLDINPFIGVLSSGGTQAEADCNCDDEVNFLDIQAFIDILSGNGN